MKTCSIAELKRNPSEAMRTAKSDVVVVTKRLKPAALLVGVDLTKGLEAKGVLPAFATALFRDGHLPLVQAAALALMPVAEFASHLSRLGIPVIGFDAQATKRDMETLDEWLASS